MSDADPVLRLPIPHVRRMLVVDSDESFVASIRRLMASNPCTIDWVKQDSEALALIDGTNTAGCYDVIFLDLFQSLQSDSTFLPSVQAAGRQLPIILTCQLGYDPSLCIVKARSMGLQVFLYKPLFLYKPFRTEQFFAAISQVCPLGSIGSRKPQLEKGGSHLET